jgi:hypothetical protein
MGVTGGQGMLTPSRHVFLPLVYPEVFVGLFVPLACNSYLCIETDHYLISY